jgi:hypothetical protein
MWASYAWRSHVRPAAAFATCRSRDARWASAPLPRSGPEGPRVRLCRCRDQRAAAAQVLSPQGHVGACGRSIRDAFEPDVLSNHLSGSGVVEKPPTRPALHTGEPAAAPPPQLSLLVVNQSKQRLLLLEKNYQSSLRLPAALARGDYVHEYDPATGHLAHLTSPDAVGLHYVATARSCEIVPPGRSGTAVTWISGTVRVNARTAPGPRCRRGRPDGRVLSVLFRGAGHGGRSPPCLASLTAAGAGGIRPGASPGWSGCRSGWRGSPPTPGWPGAWAPWSARPRTPARARPRSCDRRPHRDLARAR